MAISKRTRGFLRSALIALWTCFPALTMAQMETPAKPLFGLWGIETQYMAPELKPGDDFYRYVNQGWLTSAKIPDGLPMNGAFVGLMLRTEQQVAAILDGLGKQTQAAGTAAQQVADLYASFVDTGRRNTLGASPLQAELTEVLKLDDKRAFAARMGRVGYTSLAGLSVDQDPAAPSHDLLNLGQSALGLPGRDYYLKQ